MDRLAPVFTPDNPKLADAWLIDQARKFASAADAYTTRGVVADSHVLSFLLGRSMELALKAYLIRNGATEKQLRRLGHALADLLDAAAAHGFGTNDGLTMVDAKVILQLSDDYQQKYFEYPELRGYAGYSDSMVRTAAHNVLTASIVAMWGADYYTYLLSRKQHNEFDGLTIAADANYS